MMQLIRKHFAEGNQSLDKRFFGRPVSTYGTGLILI